MTKVQVRLLVTTTVMAAMSVVLFAFLRQEPAAPLTVSYFGTGVSSADRTDVTFKEYLLDKQLPRDAIRPIYGPSFIAGSQALLHNQTYVIGLEINGQAKAYPIGELNFREMVNDTVGGVPVLVTW